MDEISRKAIFKKSIKQSKLKAFECYNYTSTTYHLFEVEVLCLRWHHLSRGEYIRMLIGQMTILVRMVGIYYGHVFPLCMIACPVGLPISYNLEIQGLCIPESNLIG